MTKTQWKGVGCQWWWWQSRSGERRSRWEKTLTARVCVERVAMMVIIIIVIIITTNTIIIIIIIIIMIAGLCGESGWDVDQNRTDRFRQVGIVYDCCFETLKHHDVFSSRKLMEESLNGNPRKPIFCFPFKKRSSTAFLLPRDDLQKSCWIELGFTGWLPQTSKEISSSAKNCSQPYGQYIGLNSLCKSYVKSIDLLEFTFTLQTSFCDSKVYPMFPRCWSNSI